VTEQLDLFERQTKFAPGERKEIKRQIDLMVKLIGRLNLTNFRRVAAEKYSCGVGRWLQDVPIGPELESSQTCELFYRALKWDIEKQKRYFDAPTHAEACILLSGISLDAPLSHEALAEFQLAFLVVYGPEKFREIFGAGEKINMAYVKTFRQCQNFAAPLDFNDSFYKPYRKFMTE
jgi:hypothetical protein